MKFLIFLIIFYIGKSSAKVALSDIISVCDTQNPKLNDCVVKAANGMIAAMKNGIRDYGLPPLDPLFVPKMDLGQSSGPVGLSLVLINTTHTGIRTMTFQKAKVDPKRNMFILNATLYDYNVEGDYKANGKILLVPIQGEGKASFKFLNTKVDFVIEGVPKERKGNMYLTFKKFRVYFTFSKVQISIENLFNGNKELGDRTNMFLNENSFEVVNALKGTFEDVYSALYEGLVTRIMMSVPYKQLFKDLNK